jgi:hypothetical protein
MKFHALLHLVCALALTALTAGLGLIVLMAFAGVLLDSLQYGSVGGGKEGGFPLLLAIVVFFLARWTREIWRAWGR